MLWVVGFACFGFVFYGFVGFVLLGWFAYGVLITDSKWVCVVYVLVVDPGGWLGRSVTGRVFLVVALRV